MKAGLILEDLFAGLADGMMLRVVTHDVVDMFLTKLAIFVQRALGPVLPYIVPGVEIFVAGIAVGHVELSATVSWFPWWSRWFRFEEP